MKNFFISAVFILSILIVSLTSCSEDNFRSSNIRTLILSKDGSTPSIKVYLENTDGSIINGAVIIAENTSSIMTTLDFSNENQYYSGALSSNEDETYTLTIKSNAFNEINKIQVPHTVLTEKPVISTFTDSQGNNALAGESLSKSYPIQISWNMTGSDVCYQISVKTSFSTLWTASTFAPTVSIPSVLSYIFYLLYKRHSYNSTTRNKSTL